MEGYIFFGYNLAANWLLPSSESQTVDVTYTSLLSAGRCLFLAPYRDPSVFDGQNCRSGAATFREGKGTRGWTASPRSSV